ncbi:MAG: Uma2 family endonuclease [Acidobacteriota bacterium]|nr:Uma2 family endonuclease [Acidobacteriota bacterium]
MSTTITKPTTADELFAMPDDGFRYELVEGELIRMAPAGAEHGKVTVKITVPLFTHVAANDLGTVYAAETGFKLHSDPDTVRAPDVAFVSKARGELAGSISGYWVGAPDLAIEVVSPGDTVREVEEKVREWLEAGARMVLVVSPRLRTIMVYRSLTDIVVLTEKDTLDGDDVVPGFRLAVVDVFR